MILLLAGKTLCAGWAAAGHRAVPFFCLLSKKTALLRQLLPVQLPDSSQAMDTFLFSMLYVVWPMAFGVAMFMLVLRISFAPPDDQDVER